MKFVLEGSETEREVWLSRLGSYISVHQEDLSSRRRYLKRLFDFYIGNQAKYTNVVGLTKKKKKGQISSTKNYFREHIVKMVQTMNINVPNLLTTKLKNDHPLEPLYAQTVEEFIDEVLSLSKFYEAQYPMGNFNQSLAGSFAIKTWVGEDKDGVKLIKVRVKHDMTKIIVGWSGEDPFKFNYVISLEELSEREILEEYKEIPKDLDRDRDNKFRESLGLRGESDLLSGEHSARGGVDPLATYLSGASLTPSSDSKGKKYLLVDYSDDEYSIIVIGGKIRHFEKHGHGFNLWDIGKNLFSPTSYWGLSDGDSLIDPQVDLNERSDDEAVLIRKTLNFKYIARNVPNFNAEEIERRGGQFIGIEGEGADISALTVPINIFPSQQNILRTLDTMHDLGVPKVVFATGTSGHSGRALAVSWQAMIDKVENKRKEWNRVLANITEKIQVLGYKLYHLPCFTDPVTGEFVARKVVLDWADILPSTRADKNVDVENKFNFKMISLRQALREMGYRDPDQIIKELKEEYRDKELVPIRERMSQLTEGGVMAQFQAQQMMQKLAEMMEEMQGTMGEMGRSVEALKEAGATPAGQRPTLTEEAGGEKKKMPTAAAGLPPEGQGVSPKGAVASEGQNIAAGGGKIVA